MGCEAPKEGKLKFNGPAMTRCTLGDISRPAQPKLTTLVHLAYGRARPGTMMIGRRELFLWLACILLANQLIRIDAFSSMSGLLEALLPMLMGKDVFYYLGWYAVLSLLFESRPEPRSGRTDIAVVLLIALLNFLPDHAGRWPWLSTTAMGLFVLATSQGDGKLKAAATVLLALAINGFWGPTIFEIFAFQLLLADAALVGTALSATQPGMGWNETIIGMADGHRVLIYGPCSSFHNISLGLLCWVTLTKLIRTTWVVPDILVALVVCATVILLNGSRLYLMALSPDQFTYWHDGFGEQVFAWGTTFAVLLITLWGALRLGRAT